MGAASVKSRHCRRGPRNPHAGRAGDAVCAVGGPVELPSQDAAPCCSARLAHRATADAAATALKTAPRWQCVRACFLCVCVTCGPLSPPRFSVLRYFLFLFFSSLVSFFCVESGCLLTERVAAVQRQWCPTAIPRYLPHSLRPPRRPVPEVSV